MTDNQPTASGVSEEMLDRAREWLDEQRAVVHPGPIETLRDLISMRRAALSAKPAQGGDFVTGKMLKPDDLPPPETLIDYGGGTFGPFMFHFADEDDSAAAIARANGFEYYWVEFNDVVPDDHSLSIAYANGASPSDILPYWIPPKPRDGFSLVGKNDSENGPVAHYLSNPIRAAAPPQPIPTPDEALRDVLAALPENPWTNLCDKDDRTSPEDYPDHCLITQDELYGYVRDGYVAALSRARPEEDKS